MRELIVSLRKILHICYKEFLMNLKDPATRVILIVPVFIQSILFGYAATYNLERVPYAVLDLSKSRTSSEILSKMDGSGVFQRVQNLDNAQSIAKTIDSGEAMLVISIGADFEEQLARGGMSVPLQVITDGRNTTTGAVAAGYVNEIVSKVNSENGRIALVSTNIISWYNPDLLTRWIFMPGMMATLSLIQVMLLAGLSVAREREQGTFEQLLVAPLSPMEILIGKAVPPLLIGLIQASMVLGICVFWFAIPFQGSLLTLFITLFIFTVSCIGLGLSVSAIATSMQQVMVYSIVLLMPMILLSGLATPIRNMPEVMQILTYANPMRFGVEAIRRVYLEGAGLAEVAINYPPMIILTFITMPIAAWLFRNRLT